MIWSAVAGCLWIVGSAGTAMLPMRRQYPPGITLLVLAPFLIGWLAYDFGLWIALLGVFAFASMFRNPLMYFAKKVLGMPVSPPPTDPVTKGRP